MVQGVFNLERQFSFYGAYHANPVNIAIHTVCVPIILFCGLQMVSLIPQPIEVKYPGSDLLPLNAATIMAAVYSSLYIIMEPLGGALYAPIVMGMAIVANRLTATYGSVATVGCLSAQLVAWVLQFIGHGKFEGRAPALLDNLAQAFLLGPFFVFLELLFRCGFKPELKQRVDRAIAKSISTWRKQKMEETAVKVSQENSARKANSKTNGKAT